MDATEVGQGARVMDSWRHIGDGVHSDLRFALDVGGGVLEYVGLFRTYAPR